jgi:deoxyribonuclease V
VILAVDVSYDEACAYAAAVSFERFDADRPSAEYYAVSAIVGDYTPGAFYRRELPAILHLMKTHRLQPSCLIIDGYVFLDGPEREGLGAHLYARFKGAFPVIGVAKNRFGEIPVSYAVLRGGSRRPLYVTAAGIDRDDAVRAVLSMHGSHRIPTMLKRADRMSRMLREREGTGKRV